MILKFYYSISKELKIKEKKGLYDFIHRLYDFIKRLYNLVLDLVTIKGVLVIWEGKAGQVK